MRLSCRPTTLVILLLFLAICTNETQRIMAQWQSHQERQVQIYLAKANGLKLDKVLAQNDLQLQLLMQHSTDLGRLQVLPKERAIMTRPVPRPQ